MDNTVYLLLLVIVQLQRIHNSTSGNLFTLFKAKDECAKPDSVEFFIIQQFDTFLRT